MSLVFDRGGAALAEALQRHGAMPLPPYLRRAADARDRDDYQTVFAREEGAVAAPTAGLHFTDRLLQALDARGIARHFVTLHVGAGTFLPVSVEDTADHRMHAEWCELSPGAAAAINRCPRRRRTHRRGGHDRRPAAGERGGRPPTAVSRRSPARSISSSSRAIASRRST